MSTQESPEYFIPAEDDMYRLTIEDSPSFSKFALAIRARGLEHFADTDMDPDFAEKFLSKFATYMDDALIKFAAGQREHGGDIRTRNLRIEKRREHLDLVCYDVAEDTLDDTLAVSVS